MDGAAPATVLVIGFGNTLRGDDGVGPRVAAAVASWRLPGVRALARHQLTPELAEPLAAADLVLFVDGRAADDDAGVLVQPLGPEGAGTAIGHTGDARTLLALARACFGSLPRAWLITIPAPDLALGEGLSPAAERGMEDALRQIALLLEGEAGHDSRPPNLGDDCPGGRRIRTMHSASDTDAGSP